MAILCENLFARSLISFRWTIPCCLTGSHLKLTVIKKRMQATIARSKERDAKSFETKLKLLELEKKKEQQLKETLCQIQQQKQAQLDAASKGLGLGNEVQEKKLQNGVLTNPTENKILNPVLKNVDDVPVGPAAVASRASAQNKTRLFSPKQKKWFSVLSCMQTCARIRNLRILAWGRIAPINFVKSATLHQFCASSSLSETYCT